MAEASYERQLLALQAAGYINGAGTTQVTFGCQMTRMATGHYALLLDDNNGVVSDESYVFVTPKGTAAASVTVNEVSNTRKDIYAWNMTGGALDTDIEVTMFKSVTH